MDASHPLRSMSIGHPIPDIRLFQILTLKLQGQGHGCGQRARSYSWPRILLTRLLFISHHSDQQSLRYSYFWIWPWNAQDQGHEWGQKVKVTYYTQYPTDALPFRLASIGPTIREIWPKMCLTLKTHIQNFMRKFAKITVFHITSSNSNHVITMTRAITLL